MAFLPPGYRIVNLRSSWDDLYEEFYPKDKAENSDVGKRSPIDKSDFSPFSDADNPLVRKPKTFFDFLRIMGAL